MTAEGRRIRLLTVMASMMGGGAERQMLLLLEHLDRERFAPSLCLLSAHGEFLPRVPGDVPVHDLGKRSARDLPLLVARLARLLRAQRPDVALSKVDYTNTLAIAAARLGARDVPVVAGEESLATAATADMSHPRLRRATMRWAYRRAALVVAPSEGVAEDLRDGIGVTRTPMEVVPNMVDLREVEAALAHDGPHPFGRSRDPLVVAAGRLAPAKGQRDLVEALALLAAERPCNLALLGDGADRAALEALVAARGLGDRVAFLGFVANPYAVLRHADVFVSPSHFESFGNVLVEAMAAGVPVVSTRVPAGPERIVDDGRTGVFARARDPADLARAIERVLDSPELRERLIGEGRREARSYAVDRLVPRYQRILEDVARRREAS